MMVSDPAHEATDTGSDPNYTVPNQYPDQDCTVADPDRTGTDPDPDPDHTVADPDPGSGHTVTDSGLVTAPPGGYCVRLDGDLCPEKLPK